jgi:hypothetical protein
VAQAAAGAGARRADNNGSAEIVSASESGEHGKRVIAERAEARIARHGIHEANKNIDEIMVVVERGVERVVVVDREDGAEVVVHEELALGAGGGERGGGGARAGARRGRRGRGGFRNRGADADGVDQAAGGGGATCRVACGEQFDEHVVRAKEASSFRSTSVEVVAERGSGAPRRDG